MEQHQKVTNLQGLLDPESEAASALQEFKSEPAKMPEPELKEIQKEQPVIEKTKQKKEEEESKDVE